MNVGKMYGVRIDVEPKCVTEDTEKRVYMSLVRIKRKSKWKKLWGTASGKIKCTAKVVLKLFVSYVISCATAILAFHAAYLERGYDAVGGEYLLVIASFLIAYWSMGKTVG